MDKARHAFGSLEKIDSAISQGVIDAYDILFVKDANGKPYVGWVDKEGKKVVLDDSAEFAALEAEIAKKVGAEEVEALEGQIATKVDATEVAELEKEIATKVDAATVQTMIKEATVGEIEVVEF